MAASEHRAAGDAVPREALREAEDRYRVLLESIDAGFCVIEMIYDPAGRPVDYRFLEMNPAFERQTGLKDATRKTMREHVPGHEQHWFDIYARVARTGEAARFVQAAKALMGGWYEVYAYRIGGQGSLKVGVLFNDISERVRSVEALKDADRRKDEFLATLAHELRGPLAPIRNAADFLRRKAPADADHQAAHELIGRQLDQLSRLVDDLMDVGRITLGKIDLRPERLDLRDLAQDASAASRALLERAGQRFELRLPAEPLCVDGDRVRLSQVISNLLGNAARYTPPGGDVSLEIREEAGEAVLSVVDNGIGIAPGQLERIFEPFAQLGSGGDGIGIGLSLARRLVELHGGRIEAQSEGAGRGSRFTVHLPRAAAI